MVTLELNTGPVYFPYVSYNAIEVKQIEKPGAENTKAQTTLVHTSQRRVQSLALPMGERLCGEGHGSEVMVAGEEIK